MIADSGSRMVIADADTIAAVREAVAGLDEALATESPTATSRRPGRAAVRPRIVVVGGTLRRASGRYDDLRADRGARRSRRSRTPRSSPPSSTPAARRAGRARRCSPTGRCWPTSSRSPQVEPPMIHGDDVVLGVLPLFHVYGLNAVLGGCCGTAPSWCSPTGSTRRARST